MMLKSLPPSVSGHLLGTLTVRLISRAAPGTSVRLRFWGETGPSSELTRDLCEEEYTLVGSLAALSQYLKDASPLRLQFFSSSATDGEGKRLVGSGRLDLVEEGERLLLLNNATREHKSVRLSFPKKAQIADDEGNSYGSARFELLFRFSVALPLEPTLCADIPISSQLSVFSDQTTEDQRAAIIEDLLELCDDELTMPTDASSSFTSPYDPLERWISKIVDRACTPPRPPFPSSNSCQLRNAGMLEIKIEGLHLTCHEVARESYSYRLRYRLPRTSIDNEEQEPFLVEIDLQSNADVQSRRKKSARKKPIEGTPISLLGKTHVMRKEVAFDTDEVVRHWLNGTIEFELTMRINASAPALPRVARLSSSNKGARGAPEAARASYRLRELILSAGLSAKVRVDLTSGGTGKVVGDLYLSLRLHPRQGDVKPRDETPARDSIADATTVHVSDSLLERETRHQFSASSQPHPVSAFLYNFLTSPSNNNIQENGEDKMVQTQCIQAVPPNRLQPSCEAATMTDTMADARNAAGLSKPKPLPNLLNVSRVDSINTIASSFKPVKPPPTWIDIRINQVSIPNIHASKYRYTLRCDKPLITGNGPSTNMNGTVSDYPPTDTDGEVSWLVAFDDQAEETASQGMWINIWRHAAHQQGPLLEPNSLVGVVQISTKMPRENNGTATVAVVLNGWFHVLSPRTAESIGEVHLHVAHGSLRQIRQLPAVCSSVEVLQRWWRKRLEEQRRQQRVSKIQEEPKCYELDAKPGHEHDAPLTKTLREQTDDDRVARQSLDPPSSPDSLLEAWSQIYSIEGSNRPGRQVPSSSDVCRQILGLDKDPLVQDQPARVSGLPSTIILPSCPEDAVSSFGDNPANKEIPEGPSHKSHGPCATAVDAKPSPAKEKTSDPSSFDSSSGSNRSVQCPPETALKPTRLEASFSSEEHTKRVAVDPPEERLESEKSEQQDIKPALATCHKGKPESTGGANRQILKRHRAQEEGGSRDKASSANNEDVKDEDSTDDTDTADSRSLSSVLRGLNDINSMLVQRDEPRGEDRNDPLEQTLIESEEEGRPREVAVATSNKVDPPGHAPSFAGIPAQEHCTKTGEKMPLHSPKIEYVDVSTSPCRDGGDNKAKGSTGSPKKEDSVQGLEGTIKSRVEQRLRNSLARAAASSASTPEMSSFTSSLRNRRAALSSLSPNRIGADFGRKRRSGVFIRSPHLDNPKDSGPLSATSPAFKASVSLSVRSPATTAQIAKRARLERIFRS